MRFHVLGVSFAKTNKETSADGFSQKVRLFCKMMTEAGHTIFHYGIEGSDPICTENINVVSNKTYEKDHKSYDFKYNGFNYSSETESQDEFNKNAIKEIQKRKKPNDFLCFSFGFPQRPIADNHNDLIHVEIGIGFDGAFTPYRIYESYSWMHTIYGKYDIMPNPYDAVIPNFFDLEDYKYSDKKEDYFFFIARQDPLKGIETALKCVEYVNSKLIVAGTGKPHIESPNLEFIGVVNFEERSKLMSNAKATFAPTIYNEPFGSTVIESSLCGTPVISTDWGAFTETVQHGLTGYRCRTTEQFLWATKNIDNIKPINCRKYAEENYSLNRISKMYEDYFNSLLRLRKYGENDAILPNPNRKEINWLNKYYPDKVKDHTYENKKEILTFLVGYDGDIEKRVNDNRNIIMKVAESFINDYNVYVFGTNISNININGVKYLNSILFNDFQEKNHIKITILSRYLFPFAEHEMKSDKIYLWLHDYYILPYYDSREINNLAKGFLKNILHKIDRIITVNNHNKEITKKYYNLNDNIINVIKNGIDIKMLGDSTKKRINKFVCTFENEEDIYDSIEYFKIIRKKIKDAEFYIFADIYIIDKIKNYEYIYSFNNNDYSKFINHLKDAEYWINLSNFNINQTIHSIESQYLKTICIIKDNDIVNEYVESGLIINKKSDFMDTINKIVDFTKNDKLKNEIIEKSYKWSLKQKWDNKIKDWEKLFKK